MTIAALLALLDEIDRQGGPEAARQGRLSIPDERTPRAVSTAPAPRPTPPTVTVPLKAAADVRLRPAAHAAAETLPIGQLLKWGDDHPDSDVRDQAARARLALAGLRRRHAADQELTALTTEREQLEKRLAELQAREAELAPAKPKSRRAPASYDAAVVRGWARGNNIPVPAVGRVPKAVVDAWRAATTTNASA